MSPKVREQLKDGRLITPTMDSMCGGLNLKVGKLYLVAGNGAKVGICNYAKEYSQMTIVERRGFAGGYKKGCSCEVIPYSQFVCRLFIDLICFETSSSFGRFY